MTAERSGKVQLEMSRTPSMMAGTYWPILGSRRGTAVAQIAAPDAGARRPRERTDRHLGVRRCVGYNLGHGQSRWMVTRAALGGYSPAVFRLRGRLGSGESLVGA